MPVRVVGTMYGNNIPSGRSRFESPWFLLGLLVVVIVVAIIVMTTVTSYYWGSAPVSYGGYGMMGGGWWGLMMLIPAAGFLLFLVFLLVLLDPSRAHSVAAPYLPPTSPGEILAARYARGEISQGEFTRMKGELQVSPP